MQANLPANYAHARRAGDAGLDLRAAGDTQRDKHDLRD